MTKFMNTYWSLEEWKLQEWNNNTWTASSSTFIHTHNRTEKKLECQKVPFTLKVWLNHKVKRKFNAYTNTRIIITQLTSFVSCVVASSFHFSFFFFQQQPVFSLSLYLYPCDYPWENFRVCSLICNLPCYYTKWDGKKPLVVVINYDYTI